MVRDASDARSDEAWPFDQAEGVAAITVKAVLEGTPILHVSHDEDDHGWQFLDGRPVDADEARVISMAEAVAIDPSVREVADLPPGWIAWRDAPGRPWQRRPRG